MFFSRLRKAYTSPKAFQKKEWENVVFTPEFSCSFVLLANNILVVRGRGFSAEDAERASLAFGANIIAESIPPGIKYVIIQDWRYYRNSTAEARKLFMDSVIGNDRLALLVFCNCTLSQKLSIKLGRALGFLKMPVHVCPTYRESRSIAAEFLETGYLPPEKISLFRFRESRANRFNEDLLSYLESIDWKTGKRTENIEQEVGHPLQPVFDTITVIRSGLEQTFLERDRADRELREYQKNLQTLVQERTAALEESERRYRLLLTLLPSPIAIMTPSRSVEYVNEAFTDLFGYVLADMSDGNSFVCALSSTPDEKANLNAFIADRSASEKDFELKTHSGFTIFVQVARKDIEGTVILSFTDITDRKNAESKLFELSLTDELTGIYNRRHFVSVLSREIQQYVRYKTPLSLVIIDIDHFKRINDAFGHQAGDAVLRELTSRISGQIRDIDYFFRIGGEEFAVVMPNTDIEPAVIVAERLRAEIDSRDFSIESGNVYVSISLGLALTTTETANPESLFRVADALLFKAKKEGRNRLCHT